MGQVGKAKRPDGTGGTTEADLQMWIASMASNHDTPSIAFGGVVTGRADMRYDYLQVVGLMPVGYGRSQVVAWPSGATQAVTAPASGSRVDVIWADDRGVHVSPDGTQPGNAVILSKRKISAGATSTANTEKVWDTRFMLPYGSTLGVLAEFKETYAQGAWAVQEKINWCTLDFWVPTDRRVVLKGHQCIYGQWVDGSTDPVLALGIGSFRYAAYLDGQQFSQWEMGYDRVWTPRSFEIPLDVTQGAHTVRIEREKMPWSTVGPKHFGGGTWQAADARIVDVAIRE